MTELIITQADYDIAERANVAWGQAINGPHVAVLAAAMARIESSPIPDTGGQRLEEVSEACPCCKAPCDVEVEPAGSVVCEDENGDYYTEQTLGTKMYHYRAPTPLPSGASDELVERVKSAMKTWSYAKSPMLNGYRIVSGGDWKVFEEIAEASAALDYLNAQAVIAALSTPEASDTKVLVDALERCAQIVERNLYRQHEKIEDVPKIARQALALHRGGRR